MSNLRIAIVATVSAVIFFPLGVLASDQVLKGHPNLQQARHSLSDAQDWISKSQAANEHVWGVEGGHGQKAKEAIGNAKRELDLAAEWVNSHEK
jgi:hypothetical protein